MAGFDNNKTVEQAVSFERTTAEPLDKYDIIGSLATLTLQIPLEVRYEGQMVYVNNLKKWYFFKDGVTNNDLKPLMSESSVRVFDTNINTVDGIMFELEHSLDSGNINVTFTHNDESIIVGWKRGKIDGSDKSNFIHFSTNADYNNLQIFIIGNDISGGTDLHPNLDGDISGIKNKVITTHVAFDDFQKIGDILVTTDSDFNNFQKVSDTLKNIGLPKSINGDLLLLSDSVNAPSPTDSGVKGEVRIIGTFRYECVDDNVWTRSAIETTWV